MACRYLVPWLWGMVVNFQVEMKVMKLMKVVEKDEEREADEEKKR
jgi:hypothetical protein